MSIIFRLSLILPICVMTALTFKNSNKHSIYSPQDFISILICIPLVIEIKDTQDLSSSIHEICFNLFFTNFMIISKKIKILILPMIMLILTACGSPNTPETAQQTWTVQLLSGEASLLSGEIESGSISIITGENLPIISTLALFPTPLCNSIVDLYTCIIEKAPIENQPLMRASLEQVIEPRKLMADAQLREVCQEITTLTTFQEVMQHYTGTGHGCKF